ncbi:hypothetical protein RRF57_012842 [Xylaria bambusicola]|uniref:Uncharacterized protein n=1 Tax=Xylaria bambusicola TaxID=326684 RepID=A0AAN7Z4V0_9PEZI
MQGFSQRIRSGIFIPMQAAFDKQALKTVVKLSSKSPLKPEGMSRELVGCSLNGGAAAMGANETVLPSF